MSKKYMQNMMSASLLNAAKATEKLHQPMFCPSVEQHSNQPISTICGMFGNLTEKIKYAAFHVDRKRVFDGQLVALEELAMYRISGTGYWLSGIRLLKIRN
jgi:hypothetical protein